MREWAGMKIIAAMPSRNEAWIIERNLKCLSAFCDAIIVADQNSTDATRGICRGFPKVHLVDNPSNEFNERERRQILLDAVRSFNGQNLVLALDADEILTATILNPCTLTSLIDQMKPGMSAMFQWITLWRHPFRYRDDQSVWSNNWKHFAYWDNRRLRFEGHQIHLPRAPESTLTHAVRFKGIKVLHYQFVTWQRMLSKQRYYRVLERVMSPAKTLDAINQTYVITRDERGMVLKQVPDEWVRPWQDMGVDLEHFAEEELYWYDIEVLRFFAQHGVKSFADLDIWDVDWEQKRQLALAQGYDGLPVKPIRDPRNPEQRLYHAYLHRYIDTPWWRLNPLKVARRMAKRLGLKRAHLEQRGITQS